MFRPRQLADVGGGRHRVGVGGRGRQVRRGGLLGPPAATVGCRPRMNARPSAACGAGQPPPCLQLPAAAGAVLPSARTWPPWDTAYSGWVWLPTTATAGARRRVREAYWAGAPGCAGPTRRTSSGRLRAGLGRSVATKASSPIAIFFIAPYRQFKRHIQACRGWIRWPCHASTGRPRPSAVKPSRVSSGSLRAPSAPAAPPAGGRWRQMVQPLDGVEDARHFVRAFRP